ncbi:hypothetical protein BJY04DRAFT_225557 [Aspergillus karnatakaensis]|uniref:uncharacterized protein n=1 Tax=Aspergillus karnatakaensis TaxID=1810916 RepID=UPI003CCE223D
MSSSGTGETIQERRQRLSLVPRAMRIRKIRCDRSVPCSNCQASKISCRHPNDRTRSQLQKDKIENLEALVESLDQRFRDLESKFNDLERQQVNRVENAVPVESRHVNESQLFEGDSSFTSQSHQASRNVQSAALSTGTGDGLAIQQSLDHLQRNLNDSNSSSRNNFFFKNSTSLLGALVTPLPAAVVTSLLRRMKTRRPIFLSSYALSDLQLFESLCQNVYSKTSRTSVGQIASMHGVLSFVLKELIAVNDELSRQFDLKAQLDQCEKIFTTAIETYEVLAVPSYENILALTMGMTKAQGEAKPSLYWTLASAAATQCQSLGYHSEATYRNISSGKAESIRRLFWTVYVFDKNISLLLGRISNMQGLKVDTRHPTISTDPALRPWDESFIMGIRLAEIQGRIFTGLYSPETSMKAVDQRNSLINQLSAGMEQWQFDLKQINPQGVNSPQVFELSRGNWDISFYSTLTLLFHASSTTATGIQISSQCFNAARNSLHAHLKCFPQYQQSNLLSESEYFNWILLFSSFTPFVVVFLHAIAAKDMDSVKLLAQVVATFENFRKTSHGSERLYQICATFAQLAEKIIESQLSPIGIYDNVEDSLVLEDVSGASSFFNQDTFQDLFDIDDANRASSLYATDVLNDWVGGDPFLWDKFDMDAL